MAEYRYNPSSSVRQYRILSTSPSCRGSPVTFGVEIEAIFAFTQQKLQGVLEKYYSNSPLIIKTFPDRVHDCLLNENDWSHQCRNLYPSWALQVPTESDTDPSLQIMAHQSTSMTGTDDKIRPYLAEPLIIAKEAIESNGVPIDVKAQIRRSATDVVLGGLESNESIILRAQSANYGKLTLTSDHTLIGCLESQIVEAVGDDVFKPVNITDPDGITRTSPQKQWDSSGIELISPICTYSDKSTAFTSIARCLNSLSLDSAHKLIPSTWASLQVHVGLDVQSPQDIPLPTLQHLAYILICHQDLISKLHPRSRCGFSLKSVNTSIEEPVFDDSDDFDPNAPLPPEKTPAEIAAEDDQYLRENDERVLAAETRYTGHTTTNSNALYFCHATSSYYPPTPKHVASQLFNSETLLALVSLLQKPSQNSGDAAKGHRYRGYMYNFDNILTMYLEDSDTWKKGKPTIEFRQHACSVDPDEVKRWVELCFALVKLAQYMAEDMNGCNNCGGQCNKWEREAEKYSTRGKWPCEDIESLLGEKFAGLEEDDVRYWMSRYQRFKDDRPTAEEIDYDVI